MSHVLKYGDRCRANCGAPARYLRDGLCLYVSAMSNDCVVALASERLPKGSFVLPSDEMLSACCAGLRWRSK